MSPINPNLARKPATVCEEVLTALTLGLEVTFARHRDEVWIEMYDRETDQTNRRVVSERDLNFWHGGPEVNLALVIEGLRHEIKRELEKDA